MADPARKQTPDIEPDIRPSLRSIRGGGESTPDRANLQALNKKEEAGSSLDNDKSVDDQERNPSNVTKGPWDNKTTESDKTNTKAGGKAKKTATGFIIAAVIGTGVGFSALSVPGLLIVQFKEVMLGKFNTQLASMDARTNKILRVKLDGATKGLCGSIVSVGCRYSTMTDAEVQSYKKLGGIEVQSDTPGAKRVKPTGLKMPDGKIIAAKDFVKTYNSDANFRNSLRNVYNPQYASLSDSKWATFARRVGLKKSANLTGNNDAERTKNLNKITKNGAPVDRAKSVTLDSEDPENKGKTYGDTEEGRARYNQIQQATDSLEKTAKSATKVGSVAAANVGEAVTEGVSKGIGSIGNFFKITGVVDTACQAYGAVQTLGYAAKTVRAVQLIRYAMVFLNTADMIKAGTAKPGDVAYLGTILTSLAYDAKAGIRRGSATSSAGYMFAAYGDVGKFRKSNYTSQFLAGGGLTGDLINVTSQINSFTGGKARTTCRTLANPWVQAGSIVAGIAIMFIPVAGQATIAVNDVLKGAAMITFTVAMAVLPEMLKDVVAGNVAQGLVGEDAGDAITSGASGLMGGVGNAGGNGAMTKDDAVAYNDLQKQTVAMYSKDSAASLSQFDPYNKDTFVGSVVYSILPYISSLYSPGSSISSLANIVSSSISNIIPKSNALSDQQYKESLDICQDYDYTYMKIATDPFCNVIYGIPPKYLDKDPVAVADGLAAKGLIDSTTGEPLGEYASFVSDCIGREKPLGSSGETLQDDDGSKCVVDDNNADYYLYYVDQRIETGMSGGDSVLNAAVEDGYPGLAFYNGSDNIADNVAVNSNSSSVKSSSKSWDISHNNIFSLSSLRLLGIN
ncbi:MAG TPA: hypothetical protein PKC86_00655 [Candidatus Saccharibacteria bacterium]|nr:hypothetical protein [Candidatus Saccharibacteria bacterium]